jgi:uncharacterized oligopeptide transporter (OPT) family protein
MEEFLVTTFTYYFVVVIIIIIIIIFFVTIATFGSAAGLILNVKQLPAAGTLPLRMTLLPDRR